MRLPYFLEMLERARDTHIKKNEDYAAASNPLENFDRAASLISWFSNNQDKTYVNHIATKLARLATLLNKQYERDTSLASNVDATPNNEPIDDSFLDLFNYVALWATDYYYRYRTKPWMVGAALADFDKSTQVAQDLSNILVNNMPYIHPYKTLCPYCLGKLGYVTHEVAVGRGLTAHRKCYEAAAK